MSEKKYRYSPEREKILQLVCNCSNHPSAEWVFQELQNQGVKISLATVYRNLGILCEQQKLKKLDILGDKEIRYDSCTDSKGYFVCKKEKKIFKTQNPENLQIPSQKFDTYYVCTDCDYKK